jgi:mannosyltransferase OCH1-like enzyme
MRVVILVPRRDDGGWRDKLWGHCKAIWQKEFPEWQIFEGYHTADEGPFNRALAVNRASEAAGGWDVALVIDSDTISEPEAVRRAVQHAWETGDLSVAHNARHMLNRRGTEAILSGAALSRRFVRRTYHDSVSCAVAIRRAEWEAVGGFDIRFEGWGFEDTAFKVAVETYTNRIMHIEQAECLHLWHEKSPEASHTSPTYAKNTALKLRYERAHFQPERVEAILKGLPDPGANHGGIPRVIHRTVPAETTDEVEMWWANFQVLHPTWELRTWRDPLDPADFPLTAHLHDKCSSGAQKAGLVRLELLVTYGGVYVDSDVEAVRPLDSLMYLPAFAAWEDEKVVPDAVLGAVPGHPAFREMLRMACRFVEEGCTDAWKTGPGVTTAVLPNRDDVLLLPPGSFYPVHYREKQFVGSRNKQPWVFLEHKWHHSWSAANQKKSEVHASLPVEIPDDLSAVICIPWRDSGDRWRQQAREWCLRYWQEAGFQVLEGGGENRSTMCNDAARVALESGADVLIFADADTWGPIPQVIEAAVTAKRSGQLVHSFTSYTKLDSNQTQRGTRTEPSRVRPERLTRTARSKGGHVSGLTAVPVELWHRLGGFDERFVGWGFEDQAFHLAAEVLGDGTQRIEGQAIHWYHRGDPTKNRALLPNDPRVLLIQEYCRAAGRIPGHGRVGRLGTSGVITIKDELPNADRMQEILSGPGGPLSPPDVVS